MDYSRCLGLCFLWLSGRRAIETRFSHFEFGLFRITNFGAAPVLGNKMENKRFALPCLPQLTQQLSALYTTMKANSRVERVQIRS